jgi:hypothetical protein
VHSGRQAPRLDPDAGERLRRLADEAAETATRDFPNLRVLRVDKDFYAADGSLRWRSGRTIFYVDDDHLSDAGTEIARPLFTKALAEAWRAASTRGDAGTRAVPVAR